MNKKFLSAILFGVLMVTSTGTFVSCSDDYDDDIARIDSELSDLKSQIAALQTQVDAGKYITGVTSTSTGLTITLNDGTSYNVANGKDGAPGAAGEAGAAGKDGTIITVENGYWVIDGETTEYVAVTADQLGATVNVKTPEVNDEGYWVFYDGEGEAHVTTIKAAPVTAVQNSDDKSYTLTVYSVDGTYQTIKLPTAATMLTEIVVSDATQKVEVSQYTFTKPSKWDGPRALVPNNSKVFAVSGLDIRVNPVGIDVTDIPFTLVNTKNSTFPQIEYAATAESGDNALKLDEIEGRAANTGNGLWSLGMQSFILSESDAAEFNKALNNAGNVAYAVTAGTNARSLYCVEIAGGSAKSLTAVQVRSLGTTSQATLASSPITKSITVDVNKTYTIDPVDEEAFYDMYFTIDPLDQQTYGVAYNNEARTFTVTKKPDVVTTDLSFNLTVTTLDNEGTIKKAVYKVNLSSTIDAPTDYSAVNYNIVDLFDSSNDNNYFNIDLDILKNALGSNYVTWANNVSLISTRYYIGEKADGSGKVQISGSSYALTTSIVDANGTATTNVSSAKNIRVNVNKNFTGAPALLLDKQYYLTVEFRTASSSINSITIPVTFTAPSVADQFTPKSAYVVDNTINAYYYNTSSKAVELSRYFDAMDDEATLALKTDDAVKKVGSTTYNSSNLANLSNSALTLNTAGANATTGVEVGYGETLTVNAFNTYYKDSSWAYSTDSKKSTSFTIKIMSPIYEGTITPASGSSIKVIANAEDGYDITSDMIIAKDYTGVTTYNIMPDKAGNPETEDVWTSAQINKVTVAKSGSNNTYIKSVELTRYTAPGTNTAAKLGTINVKAEPLPNATTSAIVVSVTDAWGYTSAQTVPVTISME